MDKVRRQKLKNRQQRNLIVKWDHPALHTVSDPVLFDDDVSFLYDLKKACDASKTGVGIAANQTGVTKRAFYIAPPDGVAYFLINPKILNRSSITDIRKEGCLSFPDVFVEVKRAIWIEVEAFRISAHLLDKFLLNGRFSPEAKFFFDSPERRRIEGFECRIVLHEYDHIDGICLVGDEWKRTKSVKP